MGAPSQGRCPASQVNDGACPEKPDHLNLNSSDRAMCVIRIFPVALVGPATIASLWLCHPVGLGIKGSTSSSGLGRDPWQKPLGITLAPRQSLFQYSIQTIIKQVCDDSRGRRSTVNEIYCLESLNCVALPPGVTTVRTDNGAVALSFYSSWHQCLQVLAGSTASRQAGPRAPRPPQSREGAGPTLT